MHVPRSSQFSKGESNHVITQASHWFLLVLGTRVTPLTRLPKAPWGAAPSVSPVSSPTLLSFWDAPIRLTSEFWEHIKLRLPQEVSKHSSLCLKAPFQQLFAYLALPSSFMLSDFV